MTGKINTKTSRRGKGKAEGAVPRVQVLDRAIRVVFYSGLALGSALCFPEYFYDGFETPKLFSVQVAAALIVLLWLIRSFRGKELSFRFPLLATPLLVLFLLAVLSVGWSLNRLLALERLYHVGALAAFLIFAWTLYRGREIKGPLYFVICVGGAVALWALVLDWVIPLRMWVYPHFIESSPGWVVDHYRSLTSNQGNPNFLLHILVLTAPAALGAIGAELSGGALRSLKGVIRLAGLILALAAELLCFFSSQNRSGVVAVILALVLFAAVALIFKRKALTGKIARSWKRITVSLLILAAALVFYLKYTDSGRSLAGKVATFGSQRLANWKMRIASLRSTENIDVYSRVVFLETGKEMIADDPLLGKGIGQFVIYYPRYKTVKHWLKFELLPPEITMWTLIPSESHNEYLQVLLELGGLGLAAFLAFWVLFARTMWKCLGGRTSRPDFYLLLGAAAGLAGTLANAMLTFPLQTVTSGVLVWTTTGLLIAGCPGNEGRGLFREISLKIDPRKLPGRLLTAALALLMIGCLWASQRIVHGEYLFHSALKNHALDLGASIRENKKAADLLPGKFEIQYVEGWLARLAGDSTTSRKYYERSLEAAPYFPRPYEYLPDYYYRNGDYRKAEQALRRYQEIYTPGIPQRLEALWGVICLEDTSADRFAEADYHLRRAGNDHSRLILAGEYLRRGEPDSATAILREPEKTLNYLSDYFCEINYLIGVSYLALGDSAAAKERFEKIVEHGGEQHPEFVENARRQLEKLKPRKN